MQTAFFLKFKNSASSGVTLLELCIAMMVMSVLSVGVASMIRSGVESQMNDRMYNTMHLVATNLMGDLRFDLSRANAVSITAGGAQLNITDEEGDTVTYQVYTDPTPSNSTVTSIRRIDSDTNTTKIYNRIGASEYRPSLRISCDPAGVPGSAAAPCFQGLIMQETAPGSGIFNMVANTASPTQIQVADFNVYSPEYVTGTDRSYLQSFGLPRYRLQNSSFEVLSNLQFN